MRLSLIRVQFRLHPAGWCCTNDSQLPLGNSTRYLKKITSWIMSIWINSDQSFFVREIGIRFLKTITSRSRPTTAPKRLCVLNKGMRRPCRQNISACTYSVVYIYTWRWHKGKANGKHGGGGSISLSEADPPGEKKLIHTIIKYIEMNTYTFTWRGCDLTLPAAHCITSPTHWYIYKEKKNCSYIQAFLSKLCWIEFRLLIVSSEFRIWTVE